MPIYYGCDACEESGEEVVCWRDRDELRVMPDGEWLCEHCFGEDAEHHGVKPISFDENGEPCDLPLWSEFPLPPRAYADGGEAAHGLHAEILRLRAALEHIVDVYDARSELFASDADCAGTLADLAKRATRKKEEG